VLTLGNPGFNCVPADIFVKIIKLFQGCGHMLSGFRELLRVNATLYQVAIYQGRHAISLSLDVLRPSNERTFAARWASSTSWVSLEVYIGVLRQVEPVTPDINSWPTAVAGQAKLGCTIRAVTA
jgi:hypothetical protein